mmetsp:Transcript_47891/g.95241  ORF Transcript_47891/g.95241 Transcript_47891/m.95241 type:complete len:596 (+) Transcript_47891:65-1852(+)
MSDGSSDDYNESDTDRHMAFDVEANFFEHDISDEDIRRLAMRRARCMAEKGGMLTGRIKAWTHALQGLPVGCENIRQLIVSFLPSPFVGESIVSLHNGHEYIFMGVAGLRAGQLRCSGISQSGRWRAPSSEKATISVQEYFTRLGHRVAADTQVAYVSRDDPDYQSYFEPGLCAIPLEFAVVPPDHLSCDGSMFEACDGLDEDGHDECELESMYEDCAESEPESMDRAEMLAQCRAWDSTRAICKNRLISKPSPTDMSLLHAVCYMNPYSIWNPCGELSALEGVGVTKVHQLLLDGANPSAKSISDGLDAMGLVMHEKVKLRKHIESLLDMSRPLRPYVACSWMHLSKHELRQEAEALFQEELDLTKSAAFLSAAARVWETAGPLAYATRVGDFIWSSGVVFPGRHALQKEFAAVVRAKKMRLKFKQSKDNLTKPLPFQSVNRKDVEDLAEAMWKHAEREKANQAAQDLKRKQQQEEEREARAHRKEVEKEAKRRRMEEQSELRGRAACNFKLGCVEGSPAATWEQQGHCKHHLDSAGPTCRVCGRGQTEAYFSKSQLQKYQRPRCRDCIAAQGDGQAPSSPSRAWPACMSRLGC